MESTTKKATIYTIGIIYFISFWCLTIGFFTPAWIFSTSGKRDDSTLWNNKSCLLGLIYSWCDQDSGVMTRTLIMMSVGLTIKYISVAMIGLGILFDLWKYTLFMTMLSILFGTFYPAAAIIVLVSTIYAEVYFEYQGDAVGYSVILCTVAGALMLIVFVSLVVYDHLFVKERRQASWKHMHTSSARRVNVSQASGSSSSSATGPSLRKYKDSIVGAKGFKRHDDGVGLRKL